ncbi:MAG: amidohydrolase [Actinomycetaceae bacterium]|jgi:imidazolonepropionase-like amidohydrolase|nr:amidohydrolase [Actinomycetaceae bacterium]
MTGYHLTGTLRGSERSEVWIKDGIISYSAPSGPVEEITGWIYPGLLDAHTHPGLSRTAERVSDAEVLRRLMVCRGLGVTHIREMGAQRDVAPLLGPGLPKVLRAGQHLARPMRYLRYLAIELEPRDLPAEAERQAHRGDGWVKIVGDWIDRSEGADSDLRALWPRNVLVDAVAAVHDAGARVAVHTFAARTVDDLLEAGVDSIEHGSGMVRDHFIEARDQGILVDPTLRQVATFPDIAARAIKYPVYKEHMLAMDARRRDHVALMLEVGGHFIMGSDTDGDVAELGGLPRELICAVADGMPTDVVMAAASYDGRRLVGLPTWEEGAPADFVVYDADPEEDITVTKRPTAVIIDGLLAPIDQSPSSAERMR